MNINYAVVTFTSNSNSQIVEVSSFLRSKNMVVIADWFDTNNKTLYGSNGGEWKPFLNSSFQALEEGLCLNNIYNITDKIDRLMSDQFIVSHGGFENAISDALSGIGEVNFIIDIFTLCSRKYLILLRYIAQSFGRERRDSKSSVCVVCPFGFDNVNSEAISDLMCLIENHMHDVHLCFTKGICHRLVTHELGGLKNYLYELRIEKIPPSNAPNIPFPQETDPKTW